MPKIPNMGQIMEMAQKMTKELEEKMNSLRIEGNAGGGMVKVVMNGHKTILSLTISKEVVDPDDIEMLQDLITAAVNDAQAKVDENVKGDLGANLPGGLGGLPGGFPFPGM
jgi:DNA-binding YbaB/EbfC family protein